MPAAKKDESRDLLDGQQTIYRGNLYVHINDDGEVDFDIVRAERRDAPALMMACLIMCMRLTRLVDPDFHSP
jgi:hypothetical protein